MSLIGKNNNQNWYSNIISFKDLEYGSVVSIQRLKFSDHTKQDYIYLPGDIASKLFASNNNDYDVFVTYTPNFNYPIKYWYAYQFEKKYPMHANGYAEIIEYITHIKRVKDIKFADDIEKIFNKYNLKYRK